MTKSRGNSIGKIVTFLQVAILILATIATGCRKDRQYIGEWEDVNQPSRFAKVYYDGDALIWEDNEGKYPAKMDNGQLKVSAGIAEVTVQYVESSDHLIAAGSEFKRQDSK